MAKTWQVVLATVAIFVAGLVTGAAFTLGAVRWVARHPRVNPAQLFPYPQGRPGQPAQIGPQLMRSFINQLDLTDEQRGRIQPIVRRTVAQLARERREVQLNSALIIEKMQDEIAELLTPEQRVKFEDLISRQRARLQQFRQGVMQQQGAQPWQGQQLGPAPWPAAPAPQEPVPQQPPK
jgi:Spy/CpxP family protein refolding chaperone